MIDTAATISLPSSAHRSKHARRPISSSGRLIACCNTQLDLLSVYSDSVHSQSRAASQNHTSGRGQRQQLHSTHSDSTSERIDILNSTMHVVVQRDEEQLAVATATGRAEVAALKLQTQQQDLYESRSTDIRVSPVTSTWSCCRAHHHTAYLVHCDADQSRHGSAA